MAQYRGFSYDELVKPLESVQKAHNEVITDMASLSQNSEILDYYLDPDRDKQSYGLYNKFKNELNFNVDDFARNGLTRNNGMKLLSLHRNYNNNVANVLDAIKSREADRAEQQKLQETSKGQTIFGLNGNNGDANIRSVDFYLNGNKGFAHQNLDDVREEAKKFATAASKRKYTNNFDKNVNENNTEANLKALAGQYWQMMERTGYDNRQAYRIINYLMDEYEHIIDGKDVPDYEGSHPDGFIRNMRRMLQERNIDQFSDEDKGRMISAYINGIDEGLTYDPKYTWKETDILKKAGRNVQTVNVTNGGTADQNDTIFNENTIPVEVKRQETKKQREKNIEYITKGYNKFFTIIEFKGTNVHTKLKSYDEWYKSLNEDSNGNKTIETNDTFNSTIIKDEKQAQELYKSYLDTLKKEFLLSNDDMKNLMSGADARQILQKASDRIESLPLAVSIPTTELIVPGDQIPSVLEMTKLRGRSDEYTGALTGLYTDNEGNYHFNGKVSESELDSFYNLDKDKQKGCIIQLVYAPYKNDLFQVAFSSSAWSEPIFFPLSAFASSSGSKEAKKIMSLREAQSQMIEKMKEYLGKNKSDEEIVTKMKQAMLEKDYFSKKLLIMVSKRGQLKSNSDIFDDIVVDVNSGNPIKYKTEYRKQN